MNKALEDLQSGRDPFAARQRSQTEPGFYHRFATLSVTLPILGAAFCKGMTTAMEDVHGTTHRWLMLGTGAVFVLLTLTGLVLGIIALSGIPRVGRDGIFGRSFCGVALSLLFLSFFALGFVRGFSASFHNRVLARTVAQSAQEIKNDAVDELKSGHGLSLDKQQDRIGQLKVAMDSASQNGSGDQALFAKAVSACLGRLQAEVKNYAAAAKPLQNGAVLDMSGVTRREQLSERKNQVRAFMAANERLQTVVTNQEGIIRQELENTSMSADLQEAFLKKLRDRAAIERPLQEQIRNDDRRAGVAALGMLDVLDANWGKWTCSAQKKKILFENDATLDQYLQYRDELEAASKEQAKLQLRLLSQ